VAIAATVLSCARVLGGAGGGGGIRARRHDGLRPKILPPRAPRYTGTHSADHADAAIWGLTELMLDPEPVPGVRFFEVPNLPPY